MTCLWIQAAQHRNTSEFYEIIIHQARLSKITFGFCFPLLKLKTLKWDRSSMSYTGACVSVYMSLWNGSKTWLAFSIQWHIISSDLSPTLNNIQWYMYIYIKEGNFISRHALSWTADLVFSMLKRRASLVLTYTDWIKKTSTLCAAVSVRESLTK